MIQKLKTKLLILGSLFMIAIGGLMPAAALAQCSPNNAGNGGGSDCIQGGLCNGAQNLAVNTNGGTSTCNEGSSTVSSLIRTIINILSIIVGVVAVIMIIIGGFRYITSGGKQESVTAAKNTILYAVIGLVIVALAQIIVRFVLTKTTSASG
jgi:Type IV secretion system pilin